jgi:23S rRNA (guanosine2251-2'-O)-methyltransferase
VSGRTVIAGRRAVFEALRGGRRQVEQVYFADGGEGSILKELRTAATSRHVPIEIVSAARLDALAAGMMHQGVVALAAGAGEPGIAEVLALAADRGEPPFIVALDELKDPQNVGAIIRTAEAAGAHGLVMTRHRSAPVGLGVERASAGAVEHLAVVTVVNLRDALTRLKDAGCWIVGADMSGAGDYTAYDFNRGVVVVLGEEEKGLRDLTRKTCDDLVRIPLRGKVASLNVSAAAAILLYEVVRQRGRSGT